jgi:tetratricopeptide (TPR) repeat protein
LEYLQWAAAKHPSLQEDTYYVAQMGLLEEAIHRDTPAARLYRANLLERGSRYQQADEIYEHLLRESPADSPVRREAKRALLRSALNDLNVGQTDSAIRQLESLHNADTCNLKVNYLLQIAYLRSGRYEAVPPLVDQMDAIYKYFQYLNKQSIQYAAHDNAMIADCLRNDLDAAILQARKAVEP